MLSFLKNFTNFFENIFGEQKLPSSPVADFLGQNVKFFKKFHNFFENIFCEQKLPSSPVAGF